MKKFDEQVYALALRIVRFNRSHGADGDKDSIARAAEQCGHVVWYHEYPAPFLAVPRGPLDEAVNFIAASKKRHPTPLTVRREEKEQRERALYWNQIRYMTPHTARYTMVQTAANNLRELKKQVFFCSKRPTAHKAQIIARYAEDYAEAVRNMREEATARMNYPEQVVAELAQEFPDVVFEIVYGHKQHA